MGDYYYLTAEREVVPLTWDAYLERLKRFGNDRELAGMWGRVGDSNIGRARISTVFLGLDHRFGDGPPMLFETLVFGGSLDGEMERYSTWAEAEARHAAMVERVRRHEDGC